MGIPLCCPVLASNPSLSPNCFFGPRLHLLLQDAQMGTLQLSAVWFDSQACNSSILFFIGRYVPALHFPLHFYPVPSNSPLPPLTNTLRFA
jgi:hypothetical protein